MILGTVDVTEAIWSGETAITNSWVDANDRVAVTSTIVEILEEGGSVVMNGSSYALTDLHEHVPLMASSIGSDDMIAMNVDQEGIFYQYIATGYDSDVAVKKTMAWVERSHESHGTILPASDDGTGWKLLGYSEVECSLANRGDMTVTYILSRLIDHSMGDGLEYYSLECAQSCVPNIDNGFYLSDVGVKTFTVFPEFDLLTSGPDTTSGTSSKSHSITVGLSGTKEGAGVEGSYTYSWEYSIDDVVVTNRSIPSKDIIDIHHDVSENRNVGKGYVAHPAVIFSLENGGGSLLDSHYATTCKKVERLWGLWESYDDYITNTYQISLTVLGNDTFSAHHPSPM